MNYINTHSHIYLPQFDEDRHKAIDRAQQQGVHKILLPDIDSTHRKEIDQTVSEFPDICVPMAGIHPTSVDENYKQEIEKFEARIQQQDICAIGEIGLDLYWDTSFLEQQIHTCTHQILTAQRIHKPIVLHVRNAFTEIFELLESINIPTYTGVFHCFSGSLHDAQKAIEHGLLLGIGGVVTFKNSGLDAVVKEIDLQHIVLETDDPYLTPTPYRGKRNEPAYITYVAEKIAEIKQCSVQTVVDITTANARNIFSV
ncbi:MAG: TatD family hydrolase [Bacteroidales bacterium]